MSSPTSKPKDKSVSDHAAELERRDLQATEESRRAAEEARQRVEEHVREFLGAQRDDPNIEVDEADTAVHRLDELLARAAARPGAESATMPKVQNENKEGPVTLRPAADTKPRTERVIVVDDDQEIRMLVAELLASEGYSVRTAEDGLEALQKILKDTPPPDVILLDLGLPYLSGGGVVAALRTTHLAELPILIISGSRPSDLPRELRGEFVFVKKPIVAAELLAAVRARIGEWRATPKPPF